MKIQYELEKYFYSGVIPFKLFGRDISILVDKNSPNFEYAKKCAEALNQLSDKVIDDLCKYTVYYCLDSCDAIGAEPPELATNRDILNHIIPSELIISTTQTDTIVLHLELDCTWEEEHDLEWLIKDNRILHVGSYSDEPDDAEEEYYHNSWNYVYYKPR